MATVLVLAPHPDDETIGCGGSLVLHARAGARVVVLCLTSGELGLKRMPAVKARRVRETESKAAARILGIAATYFLRIDDWGVVDAADRLVETLAAQFAVEKPATLYLPHPGEEHPDHNAVWPIAKRALARMPLPLPELRAYEVWTPLPRHDYVTDISGVLALKTRALRAYRSQLKSFDYERAMRGLAQYRGALCGKCRFAEVFQALFIEPASGDGD